MGFLVNPTYPQVAMINRDVSSSWFLYSSSYKQFLKLEYLTSDNENNGKNDVECFESLMKMTSSSSKSETYLTWREIS